MRLLPGDCPLRPDLRLRRWRERRDLELGIRRRRERRFRALGCRQLARLRHLLVQRAAHPDPGAHLGDVLLETALHALSTALRRTGAPMRAWTSSSTAWMSCAPLLSESYAKMGMPSLEACANLVHWRITCLSKKSG